MLVLHAPDLNHVPARRRGDEESYQTFYEIFEPVTSARHGGLAPDFVQPTDMDLSKLKDTDIGACVHVACRPHSLVLGHRACACVPPAGLTTAAPAERACL